MDKITFFEKLADILDVEEVKGADALRDFDAWDSLAILSIVAMADSTFGFSMKATDFKPLVTADDLFAYFEARKTK